MKNAEKIYAYICLAGSYIIKRWGTKLAGLTLIGIGFVPMVLDGDATFMAFASLLGIPLLFVPTQR